MTKICPLLCLAIILAFTGCKSDSTDSNNAPPITTLSSVKVSNTYTYLHSVLDSLGNKVAGSDRTIIDSTTTVGAHFKGGVNVIVDSVISPGRSGNIDYLNYLPNGDIAWYDDAGDSPFASGYHSGWIVVPLTSHAATLFNDYDTVEVGTHFTRTEAYTFIAVENITLAGHTFQAAKFLEERYREDGVRDLSETQWYEVHSGVLLKKYRPDNWLNAKNGGFGLELTGYSEK
jgi:hypothetical protein